MRLKNIKNLINKGVALVMKVTPVIVPILLIINANSTSSWVNGQPKPPVGVAKYRKF